MINVLKQNQNRYLINPLLGAAGISAGGAIVGQLIGQKMGAQQAAAMAGSNKLQLLAALAQLANQPNIPELQYTKYTTPEEYQLAGTLTPETLANTELGNIIRNEQMRQAQLDVLRQYQELGTEGLSAIDRAALSEIQNQIAMQERGQREAILQNMAQRGLSGSGQELAASLAASQQATQDASMQGMRQAAMAQANRQAALQQIANMAGGLEQTDFQRAANRAQAQDVINQFNVQNRNLAQSQNLAALQAIRDANLEQRNRIAQANIDLENRQKLDQAKLQVGATGPDLSNVISNIAQSQAGQAASQYQSQMGLIGAGLQTGGSLASAYYNKYQPSKPTQPTQPVAQTEAVTQTEAGNTFKQPTFFQRLFE